MARHGGRATLRAVPVLPPLRVWARGGGALVPDPIQDNATDGQAKQ